MPCLEAIIHVKLFEAEFVVEIGADGVVQISDLSGRVDTESEDELPGSRLFCDGLSELKSSTITSSIRLL